MSDVQPSDAATGADERPHCCHHWVSHHQPDFPPEVYWVDICSMCGCVSGERLAEQITAALAAGLAVEYAALADRIAERCRVAVAELYTPESYSISEGGTRRDGDGLSDYDNGVADAELAVADIRDAVRAAAGGTP